MSEPVLGLVPCDFICSRCGAVFWLARLLVDHVIEEERQDAA
jgi:hypothetical protein